MSLSSEKQYPTSFCVSCGKIVPVKGFEIQLEEVAKKQGILDEGFSGTIFSLVCMICADILNLSGEVKVTYYNEVDFTTITGYKIDHGFRTRHNYEGDSGYEIGRDSDSS